jgi:hypothetical protein
VPRHVGEGAGLVQYHAGRAEMIGDEPAKVGGGAGGNAPRFDFREAAVAVGGAGYDDFDLVVVMGEKVICFQTLLLPVI